MSFMYELINNYLLYEYNFSSQFSLKVMQYVGVSCSPIANFIYKLKFEQ